ncbi:MAG: hypothetical protein CMA27_01585 [Euryarchaeota archaeon]|nr:hypothetical protein [Euryarchaeota archaeon]
MIRNSNTPKIFILTLIICLLNGSLIDPDSFTQELTEGIEIKGGSLILFEEYTATWCQICAEIEPDIEELTTKNNDRVALVKLHPSDGIDELGNYASSKRILSLFNNSLKQTPTFVLDGDVVFEGAPTMSQLNSMILQTQSKKSNFTEMIFSVKRINQTINFEIEISNNISGIINIMILENKVTSNSPDGDLKKYDHILKEMLSINTSNNDSMNNNEQWGFEINKSESGIKLVATFIIEGDINIENLGFIASHEVMKENHTTVLGAVKIIQGLENPSKYNNTIPIFLIFLALGIFASLGFLERKNESDVEE